jgi:phospholipase C
MGIWRLASPDHVLTLDLTVSGPKNEVLNGTLVYQGRSYTVAGGWAASGSIPGRNASAFHLSGYPADAGKLAKGVPNYIAATGIMKGPGDNPSSIDIRVGASSSLEGTLIHCSGTLLPWDGSDGLDTFDHVVVVMLENRSFDNILGYMYPNGVPPNAPRGKTFEGVTGKNLSNPVPPGVKNPPPPGVTSIPVAPVGLDPNTQKQNYFQPYPDPGEDYVHVNTQLYNLIDGENNPPYNLPSQRPLPVPPMNGFVMDYIENYKAAEYKGQDPTYAATPAQFPFTGYKQIMECFPTSALPVCTTLAEQFGVFDHWFCAVPSQTWCNRAFWNAGTSWGFVVNATDDPNWLSASPRWIVDSAGKTIFNQIQDSGWSSPLNWKIYSANPFVALTSVVHFTALLLYHPLIPNPFVPGTFLPNPLNHFYGFERFLTDCASGELPAYSFVEPRFFTPQSDMHPSTPGSRIDGSGKGDVGPVLLGEQFVWQVYDAIRRSPKRDRTLLIITFDEHGGCYDHVPPPGTVTAPDLTGYPLEDSFDFTRLGIRVPCIMVSSHIATNTVVNTPMHHGSFMKTVGKKWNKVVPRSCDPLTARVVDAPEFTEVFSSPAVRAWPEIPKPAIPADFWTRDYSQEPLSPFQRSIVEGASKLPEAQAARVRGLALRDTATINTVGEALDYLRSIPGTLPEEPLTLLK